MKRRRVTPSTAGGSLEASLEGVVRQSEIAANLPRIPGLSIEHVPSFLHVLKLTSKFFQTEHKIKPFSVVDWEMLVKGDNSKDGRIGETSAQPKGIHESIMDRMNAASNSESNPNDKYQQQKFVQAVSSWLEEVQILAKKHKRESTGDRQQEPKAKQDIPYAMFLYLWGLQQEHKRLTVRRSALFLSGLLLLRSKDCRYYIHQETHLADWVSNIAIQMDGNDVVQNSNSREANSNRKLIQLALLQKEAIVLMTHLLDKGFGKKYAKLKVATKSLQHRCNTRLLETLDLEDSMASTPQGMANWRRLRDFALVHGAKEIPKVTKLLDRADECLEILVPRIDGVRLVSQRKELHTRKDEKAGHQDSGKTNINVDDDESDDDDIDWEDGDDAKDTTTAIQHLSAVEQTMAAIKTAGSTLFTGGRLEIDFDKRLEDDTRENNNNNSQSSEHQVRARLETIVRRLSTRHLVRLSAWLDGLRNSDNLVLESASLVSLSPAKESLRLELIRRLSTLKQDISNVLSSASRLNIHGTNEAATGPETTAVPNGTATTTSLPLPGMPAAPPARRAGGSVNGPAPKKSKPKKIRRIQINYNK